MSRKSRIFFIAVVVVIVFCVAVELRYPGRAPVKLPASECDSELWNHVYEKERLQVMEGCTAVEGRVHSVFSSSDGDLHIALYPENKSVMNVFNLVHAHRTLVVEAVCDHPPKNVDAQRECAGFRSQIVAPAIGDRIRVIGSYVTDRDGGWREIHPVSRIEILR